jgi:hypothetical protein
MSQLRDAAIIIAQRENTTTRIRRKLFVIARVS